MIERLNSLLLIIQKFESGMITKEVGMMTFLVKFIDRVWIEQRIYHLETQLYTQEVYETDRLGTVELLQTLPGGNVLVFAEIGQCSWILQTRPFPWTPRMPKENEIYALELSLNLWTKKFLGSFTPRDFASQASSIRNASIASMKATKPSIYVRASISESPSQPLRKDSSPSPTVKRRKIWNTNEVEDASFSEHVCVPADETVPFPRNTGSDTLYLAGPPLELEEVTGVESRAGF
jgi:hypothetical protein